MSPVRNIPSRGGARKSPLRLATDRFPCDRIAGRFIHHRPSDPGKAAAEQQAIGVTIAAMRDAGLPVDPGLWVPRAECSQCYQGCADDPKGA